MKNNPKSFDIVVLVFNVFVDPVTFVAKSLTKG